MSELRDLYQEVILDHGKHPRNKGFPEGCNCSADGHNPLCGDRLTVKLKLEGDRVVAVGFDGQGCAISTAAASTMTEVIKGKSRAEVERIFGVFHSMVAGEQEPDLDALPSKLRVFSGVREFPMRVKCATLCWHTLRAALDGSGVASTE
jgi:nitrogen fixation NifU-like protein